MRVNLKSEKGNAMIMALSIILTLTAFSTVSLMTSVANIQMSSKYKNWSTEYYSLDKNAEDKVNQVNKLLETAESYAQNYMTEQYYLFDPNDHDYQIYLDGIPSQLQILPTAQNYIFTRWQSEVQPYLTDRSSSTYQQKQQVFISDTLTRLYYYYVSNLLDPDGTNSSVTYLVDPSQKAVYQSKLFTDSWDSDWEKGKLSVDINTKNITFPTDPIEADTVNGKTVSVKLNILSPTYTTSHLPTYTTLQQTKKVKGNPIWTNAITAAGSIGFVGGKSKIQGDLFSADKDESLYLNDNEVNASGIYSNGAEVDIFGNVYSKGNFHIIGSGSTINVKAYPTDFQTTFKNNVFSNNKLFFDNSDTTTYSIPTGYSYIQQNQDINDSTLYFVNADITGGNIYCNSLSVDHTKVDNGKIYAHGNVCTFNDIKMDNTILNSDNTTYSNGSDSTISVSKNCIGINSEAHNGDPNASSTVINNTALSGNTIELNGKIIMPGTAWAQYTGIKPDGATSFNWSNHVYYQTGESITANNADIFSAYMMPVNDDHSYPGYDYVYDQYATNESPTSDESDISSYYLMRHINTDGTDSQNKSVIPKINQLADYLGGISDKPVSNIFSGSSVEGYSLGIALLHANSSAPRATVYYGPTIPEPPLLPKLPNIPLDSQPNSVIGYTAYQNRYTAIQSTLLRMFLSKVQNLGNPIGLNFAVESTGYIAHADAGLVDKSVVLDSNGVLSPNINSTLSATSDAFVYIQGSDPSTLNITNSYSGIIYCEGDLTISGNGMFSGAIICEGNVTVEGPTITYDKEVIQNVLELPDNVAYSFFSKLTSFENSIDKPLGFVDKSIVLNNDDSLRDGINPSASGMQNSFVYIKQSDGSTYTLPSGTYSGILYCEGNLNISNDVSFNGAIIGESNVTVSGDSTISYDEGVIQSVLAADRNARDFFAPGARGWDTDITYSTTAYDGAVRQANLKRFQIVEWKEEQQS